MISDYYPPGMSGCMREGMNGNCGPDCPVLIAGDCENEEEVLCTEEEIAVMNMSRTIFKDLGIGEPYIEDLESFGIL